MPIKIGNIGADSAAHINIGDIVKIEIGNITGNFMHIKKGDTVKVKNGIYIAWSGIVLDTFAGWAVCSLRWKSDSATATIQEKNLILINSGTEINPDEAYDYYQDFYMKGFLGDDDDG